MTHTIAATSQRSRQIHWRRLRRAGALVAAALLALIVWMVSTPVLGIELVAGSGPAAQTVGPVAVGIVPLIAGGFAWAFLALLEKAGSIGRRIWLIVGCAVLALSLIGPVTMATSIGVLIALLLMHLVVGITLLFGLFSVDKNA